MVHLLTAFDKITQIQFVRDAAATRLPSSGYERTDAPEPGKNEINTNQCLPRQLSVKIIVIILQLSKLCCRLRIGNY